MKKILFLLLISVASYGQAIFDEGIQLNGNQLSTTATKVLLQDPDGLLNYSEIANFQKEKSYLPTGLLKNGALSINAINTTYNLSAGTGIITNFDNPDAPTSRIVTFPEVIGKTPTYLTTAIITYVGIQEIGTTGIGQIIEQATPFTVDQNHDLIPIGAVIHSNLTFINVVNNITNPSNDIGGQFHAFLDKLGAFNITGNKFTANGANLGLNKSAGSLYKRGSNFINNWKNANEIAQPATTYLTFRYRTQIDNEGADRINLDPTLYDVGGVLNTVPSNKFTIQTVNVFQEGAVRVQWGQTIYNSLAEAEAALPTRAFVKESNIALQAVPRAYIIMRNSTTSLQNTADVKIIEAGKFDGFISGGAAVTLEAILSALGYTPENVANKTGTLTASSVLYPNNNAILSLTNDLVHKSGTETITGAKTFSLDISTNGLTVGKGGGNIATNTALGASALLNNLSGSINIAVGTEAMQNNQGANNIGIGYRALRGASGGDNLAVGNLSLFSNTSGGFNTAIGNRSLFSNTTASNNSAIGYFSLNSLLSGANNTALGFNSGRYLADKVTVLTIANNSFFLGTNTSALADNQTNQTVIGDNATGLGSNTAVIGNSSTTQTWLGGKLTIGKSTNDGINDIQANSFISSGSTTLGTSQPTANNQLTRKDYVDTSLALKADIASPTFTGTVTTPILNISSTPASSPFGLAVLVRDGATGEVKRTSSAEFAPLNSPALTGIPTAPTAAAGTNTTQIATTAFVLANAGGTLQSVLNAGKYAEFDGGNSSADFLSGTANDRSFNFDISNGLASPDFKRTYFINNNDYFEIGSRNSTYGSGITTNADRFLELYNFTVDSVNQTVVSFTPALSDSRLYFPSKTITDNYTINTTPNTVYTVATLPTAVLNDMAIVSDATAPTYLGALVGGGSTVTPVWYNGTIWVSR